MRRRAAIAVVFASAVLLVLPAGASAFRLLSSFAPYGPDAGQASITISLVVGPDGLVYATDFQNHRVNVFTPAGEFLRAFGKEVNPTGGDTCTVSTGCRDGIDDGVAGTLAAPTGIVADATGTLYITSTGGHRIDVFTRDGNFLRAFGKEVRPGGGSVCTTASGCQTGTGFEDGDAGALWGPTGIDLGPDGLLYVSNGGNYRIDVFTPDGDFLRAFGKGVVPAGGDICTSASGCQKGLADESAGAVFGPIDVAVSKGGEVAVTVTYNRRVDVFSTDGEFHRAFGKNVNPAGGDVCTAASGCRKGGLTELTGGLSSPTGIAVDRSGNLIVADRENHRVSEYGFDGTFVRAFGEGVLDGGTSFQVCTAASGCLGGNPNTNPGAIPNPYGAAVDCRGAVYATALTADPEFDQVERFGDPGTDAPPCGSSSESPAAQSAASFVFPFLTRGVAKPKLSIELNRRTGTATVYAVVSGPGALLLQGKLIRNVKRNAAQPGMVEMLVVPTKKVRRKLRRKGRANVRLALTYWPRQGASSRQVEAVRLRMSRRGRQRRPRKRERQVKRSGHRRPSGVMAHLRPGRHLRLP